MTPTSVTECPDCGLRQRIAPAAGVERMICTRCGAPLEVATARGAAPALAFSAATLLLLIPTLFEPFITSSAYGVTRSSTLLSSAGSLYDEGWPLLAAAVFLFVVGLPLLRFAALTVLLTGLRLGRVGRWSAALWRTADALETWSMPDVFLLALAVALARLRDDLSVTLDAGALCFVGAALCSLFARAALDKAYIRAAIGPQASPVQRRAAGLSTPVALLLTAALLYAPANLYPMATIPIDLKPVSYTVLGGIVELYDSHLAGLAALVFCASFVVPILKMAGLSWCAVATVRRSPRALVGRTRTYRILAEIGRWSLVDPFTIACSVPVLQFNGLVFGRAEAAATPFAAVAVLTTLAAHRFDPRRMWDAAGANAPDASSHG